MLVNFHEGTKSSGRAREGAAISGSEARLLAGALSCIDQGVLVVAADFSIAYVNPQFTRLFRVPASLVQVGCPASELQRYLMQRGEYSPQEIVRELAKRDRAVAEKQRYRVDRQRPDGRFIEVIGNPMDDGSYVFTFLDITDRKLTQQRLESAVAEHTSALRAANEELRLLATLDPLLGIPNRRAFFYKAEYERAFADQQQADLHLLMVDLDFFKSINDRFGHDKGDAILSATAAALQSVLGPSELLSRYGGEEFVVLTRVSQPAEAVSLGDSLRQAVSSMSFAGESLHVTCSVGVGPWRVNESSITTALKRADLALYVAKAAGRNATRYFEH